MCIDRLIIDLVGNAYLGVFEQHRRWILVIIVDLLKEVCVESRYLYKHKIFRSCFFVAVWLNYKDLL